MPWLPALAGAAVDLVLAQPCAGCGLFAEPAAVLCATCAADLAPSPHPVDPLDPPAGLPPAWAAARYEGTVARLILAHKERGQLSLARPLGRLMAAAVVHTLDDPGDPVVLVPVPSRPAVTRKRGHDPVARMARVAARTLDATVAGVLRQRRRVVDQSGLSRDERVANLAGALCATRPPGAAAVVVVDDVCSSGATLAAAAEALTAVTSQRVRAAVVASPPLRVRVGR